ncbi:Lipoteichoic acid synthase 1 [Thiorhodovibrio litoralis]|nr:sulfatase [Thiorhodovibrio winogradskyi]WPL11244.1 Lipoteichoic acid synthase 1 [Thiorhodovibrio litoralis]
MKPLLSSLPSFSHRAPLAWLAALLFVVLWYVLAQTAMQLLLQVKPWPSTYARDLSAHLLLGALLFGMARTLPRFMIACATLFTALTLGNALKLSILGGPVAPDDFVAARNLFMLLDGWAFAGAVLMVAAPLVLLGWMMAWRRRSTWINLGLLALGIGLVVSHPAPITQAMDRYFGFSVWNQRANFEMRGLPIHLLQETARNLSRRETPPTREEVGSALAVLNGSIGDNGIQGAVAPVAGTGRPQRNLHMIVLESFWDPMVLTASKLSADPIDPAFRALWAETGYSHALAPVFGGYTANTEFEVLCGFPVNRDNVFFEGGLRRDAPCLPKHLADAGYRTLVSHPNSASFWNRINAYRRIGFETYWADKDFELDDMNRSFLSDESLYRQVFERLEPTLSGPTPIFNYVLTYFGHLHYPLNDRRPPVITAAEGHDIVAAYANTMYYKSRELMAFLDTLRQADPDALIVLFGDHPPFLGANFGGYTESGVLASQRGDFSDAMFRTQVETPLVVIDGRRGPLAVGDLILYELPALLLALLGDDRPSMMDLTAQTADMPSIRPLPGLHLRLDGNHIKACRSGDDAECQNSTDWLQAIETLRTDIFSGDQHVLLELHPPAADL